MVDRSAVVECGHCRRKYSRMTWRRLPPIGWKTEPGHGTYRIRACKCGERLYMTVEVTTHD